ncbi:MAG: histidine triad nucleotide-binding protein [Candidatus Hydrogenedentes bacterium]|nr:histidine triad nucleotide-binding protein [Candidatus Hydrogenedentota bacterium]
MAEDTLFAKIARGEIPSEPVYSDDEFYAFRDINPAAPTHVLVIPRKPIPKISDATEADAMLLGKLLLVANKIAAQEGLEEGGFRYVINCGEGAGQTVFHLHLHVLGGRPMLWPPG